MSFGQESALIRLLAGPHAYLLPCRSELLGKLCWNGL